MSNITLKSIEKKLGFDPMNPPVIKHEPDVVDDAPSIWAPLSQDELLFVLENCMGVSKEEIDKLREGI